MAGHPSIPLIADAYLKHLTNAGIDDIWTALTTTQSASAHGFDQYRQSGYVTAGDNASVSTTQDYSFDDWATAAVGKAAGKSTADYRPYLQRSQNYRNVFNPVPNNGWKFAQPKDAQGNWVAGFDPTAAGRRTSPNRIRGSIRGTSSTTSPASLRCSAARASSSRSSTARSIRPIR